MTSEAGSRQVAPYGTWASPITSARIVAEFVGLDNVSADGEHIFWREIRPNEGGRGVLVRRSRDGSTVDLTPDPMNVRTRVNEYGGGDVLVTGGSAFFSNFADQRLYVQDVSGVTPGQPRPLTPDLGGPTLRYADVVLDATRDRLLAVRDDHRDDEREPRTTLVALSRDAEDAGTNEGQILIEGHDFYAAPRVSPDGRYLVWIAWRHPDMPWDATELWLARFGADGGLENPRRLLAAGREAVQQPRWAPDGTLYFISDRSDWWNLYRIAPDALDALDAHDGPLPADAIEAVWRKDAEFGKPPWQLGLSTYTFSPDSRSLYCTWGEDGATRLARIDTASLEIDAPFAQRWAGLGSLRTAPEGALVFRAGRVDGPDVVVRLDTRDATTEHLRTAADLDLDPAWFPRPQALTFPTTGENEAHALYYAPCNPGYEAPAGELPPMLVRCHGGPTAAVGSALDLVARYWTSRGWAVLDVNYGGSTGYGRLFRERLRGRWGIVDVEDTIAAARYLIDQGEVDPERITIDGRSAGGLTTLLGLLADDGPFAAGASYFGVTDLCRLAEDTHKFESRYLDSLIGRWPQDRSVFEERSPVTHADAFGRPTIFLQGDEDRVVPPDQSSRMADALRERGVPVAFLLFEGEQHGFRKAENIRRALDGEFTFYARIFGYEPADGFADIEIDNLTASS